MIEIPDNRYLGKLCKRGHDWEGTEKSLRFKSHDCVICSKIRSLKFQKENREQMRMLNVKSYKKCGKAYRERKRETIRANHKRWRNDNREKLIELNRKRYESDRPRLRLYYKNNRKHYLELCRKNAKKQIESLSSPYIRKLLKYIGNCPEELIEVKRLQIKIYRLIKKGRDTNGQKSTSIRYGNNE